jgi:hypothetical protein
LAKWRNSCAILALHPLVHVLRPLYNWGLGPEVMGVGDRFRINAETCCHLAERLEKPEHQQFARELAAAWIELAEQAERNNAKPASNVEGNGPTKK